MPTRYQGFTALAAVIESCNQAFLAGDKFNFFSNMLFINGYIKQPEVLALKENLHLLTPELCREHAGQLLKAYQRIYQGCYEPDKHAAVAKLLAHFENNTEEDDLALVEGLRALAEEKDAVKTFMTKLIIAVLRGETYSIEFIESEFQRDLIFQFGRDIQQGFTIVDEHHPKGVKISFPGVDFAKNTVSFVDYLRTSYPLITQEQIFYIIYGWSQAGMQGFIDAFSDPDEGIYSQSCPEGYFPRCSPTGLVLDFRKGRINKLSMGHVWRWQNMENINDVLDLGYSELSHTFKPQDRRQKNWDGMPSPGAHLDYHVDFHFQSLCPQGDISLPDNVKVTNARTRHSIQRLGQFFRRHPKKLLLAAILSVATSAALVLTAPISLPFLALVAASVGLGVVAGGSGYAAMRFSERLQNKRPGPLEIYYADRDETLQHVVKDNTARQPYAARMSEAIKFISLRQLILHLKPDCKTFTMDMLEALLKDKSIVELGNLYCHARDGKLNGLSTDTILKAVETVLEKSDTEKLMHFHARVDLFKMQKELQTAIEGKRLSNYLTTLTAQRKTLAYVTALVFQQGQNDPLRHVIQFFESQEDSGASRMRYVRPHLKNLIMTMSPEDQISTLILDSAYPVEGDEDYVATEGALAAEMSYDKALMDRLFVNCSNEQLALIYKGKGFHNHQRIHEDKRLCERLLAEQDDIILALIYEDERFLKALKQTDNATLRNAFLDKSKRLKGSSPNADLFIRALAHALVALKPEKRLRYELYFLQENQAFKAELQRQIERIEPANKALSLMEISRKKGTCDDAFVRYARDADSIGCNLARFYQPCPKDVGEIAIGNRTEQEFEHLVTSVLVGS